MTTSLTTTTTTTTTTLIPILVLLTLLTPINILNIISISVKKKQSTILNHIEMINTTEIRSLMVINWYS